MTSHITFRLLLAPMLLMIGAAPCWADGTLTHMSGSVSILKADGKTLLGTHGAKAYPGDTLITGARGYVRMEMTDGGEMVLRPDSRLKIEAYKFIEANPAEDSFVFSMLKGGLRTVTGLIGKRGNRDAYELNTYSATIGIRGTQFDLRVCQGDCGALAEGTYIAVRFGAVQISNPQGILPVASGQVAYVPLQRPPIILPRDPGIGFTPPLVIPKLDEKKKVPASAAATTAPEQVKPAASESGRSSQTTQRSGQTASESTQEKVGKSESPEKTGSLPKAGAPEKAGQASTATDTQQRALETQGMTPAPSAVPAQAATVPDSQTLATPLTSPAVRSAPGTDCSVQ